MRRLAVQLQYADSKALFVHAIHNQVRHCYCCRQITFAVAEAADIVSYPACIRHTDGAIAVFRSGAYHYGSHFHFIVKVASVDRLAFFRASGEGTAAGINRTGCRFSCAEKLPADEGQHGVNAVDILLQHFVQLIVCRIIHYVQTPVIQIFNGRD